VDRKHQFIVRKGLSLDRSDMPHRAFNPSLLKKKWPHLSDFEFDDRNIIQATVIIGRNINRALRVIEERSPPPGTDGPFAEKTVFGWSIVGPVNDQSVETEVHSVTISSKADLVDLHQLVKRSFDIESLGLTPNLKPLMTAADRRGLDILETQTKHNGTRYQIGLMWKSADMILPDNYSSALRRLLSLERKFEKDPAMASRYEAVINEYITLGHARKRRPEELPLTAGRHWYLPHLAVEQPSKTRVVFDPSSRHGGIGLNDVLLKGPDLLVNLVNLLTIFRVGLIPLSADIEKMYHQVLAREEEQDFFSFLWRKPGSKEEPDVFSMTVHIFGAVSSPATCMYALRRTAVDFGHSFPEVASLVSNNFYVDNYIDSVDSEEVAILRSRQLTSLLKLGGFRLCKWTTSSRKVLSSIPAEDRVNSKIDVSFDQLPTEKTLGLLWNCNSDAFNFRIKIGVLVNSKRDLLRELSSIFDPLGMLAPVILKARLILREIWVQETKLTWDERLPDDYLSEWNKWATRLTNIASLSVPRCLKTESSSPETRMLHCFCDASSKGFGTVLYLRTLYPSGKVDVTFVIGKARVAPTKATSIHRLELQAALMGCRMAMSLLGPLGITKPDVVLWTDSQTVLNWLNSKTMKFHVFVANRVAEIVDTSDVQQWRYVPTKENPADDASRGLYASDISESCRWFKGPSFLSQSEEFWPNNIVSEEPSVGDPETSGPISSFSTIADVEPHPIAKLFAKSSKWTKCVNVIARIRRFLPRNKEFRKLEDITVEEFNDAEVTILQFIQNDAFQHDIKLIRSGKYIPKSSSLIRLDPYLDDLGILRVGGRLGNSDLPVIIKHPIILPKKHVGTRLIIRYYHLKLHHAPPSQMLSNLLQKFWVVHARANVRSVYHGCAVCRRRSAWPSSAFMAPLPATRVTAHQPPFAVTGVDFFGPFEVTHLRRKLKRYGVLFTCMNTRAVHIEVAANLDMSSFLMAFRRFTNIRGRVSICYSDNGTNFVAGEKELRACLDEWNRQHLVGQFAQDGVKWIFNPPAAPHYGGAWESLIKSAKKALYFVLRHRTVTDEVLSTAMSEVMGLLNSRPLTHIPVDPMDPEPLTPSHFLLLRPNPSLAPTVTSPTDLADRKTWKISQALADHFWKRWMQEYLPYLTERRKWMEKRPNLEVGDMVIISDPKSPRGHWPMGRITKVHPDAEGVVRSAIIKTKSGFFVRPITKLCLLESSSSSDLHVDATSRNPDLDSASSRIGGKNVQN